MLSSVDVLPALENRVHTNGRLNLLRALNTTDTRPFNDDFARRATITGEINVVRGSNQFASREAAEPDHGVAGTTGSLWWTWTAPADTGKVTLSTAGSAIDTVLAVYVVDSSATLGTLQRIAANDDITASNLASSVTFEAVAGRTYAVAIAGKGNVEGLVTFTLVSVPLNDAFSQARALTSPSVVLQGNNTNATAETGEPKPKSPHGTPLGRDRTLWYKWVAPETRSYQVSAFENTTDPIVTIYTGAALQTLTEVAFDDDAGPGFDSLVRFNAIAGVTYYICVDTAAGDTGRFTLSIADAAWQYVTDFGVYASPAVAPDGALYFADTFGYIHAVNPNGTRRWRSTPVEGFVFGGAIAVGADGTIYATDDYGIVYALAPATGARKWEFDMESSIWAAPAIAADGTIYIKTDDGLLYALNPDGTKKWQFTVPGDTYSSPAIAGDGTIYIASGGDSALYAITPAGTQKWRANLGATIYASPALGADGTIYIGNYDGRFFALRPDGSEKWRFDSGSPLSASPVLDARGYVYFGSYDKKLYALDASTGAKRWDYATGDIIRSTAALVADDGTIYIGSDDGFIHAVNPDGTRRRLYATAGAILSAPMLAAGRLYAASSDAKLYAFDTGNNLARSSWPMQGHNIRRVSRAADLAGMPLFTSQPPAQANASAGQSVTLASAAVATGGGAIGYQWLFNDAPLAGATSATLTIPSAQGSNTGVYRALATGPGGSVVSTSTTLTVTSAATNNSRLSNLAVRTTAGTGDRVLFVGFIVGGANTSGNKPLLIRAVGPTLAQFSVPDILPDPRLQIFSGQNLLTENNDWAGDAQVVTITTQLGAFGFTSPTSKDAALYSSRGADGYTAQISSAGTDSGIVLTEIYDATPASAFTATTPRLINVSARTHVGTGGNVLIAGFIIDGSSAKTVLIRAIGPTLGLFGVPSVLADPKLELFESGVTAAISTNDNWGAAPNAADVAATVGKVGAFPLTLESRDAVLLVTLPPGAYSAQVSGVNHTTGAALVEVYEVP